MSLFSAMNTATTGLIATQTAMDVIGNNMTNVNTTAFKTSDVSFSTLFSNTLAAAQAAQGTSGSINAVQVGLGVQVSSITTDFTQGGFDNTYNSLDFAIDGTGFFVVSGSDNYYYTRDGNFSLGDDYALLTEDGLYVQGVMADADGTLPTTASLQNIYIELGSEEPAKESSEVSLTGNLNSSSGVASSTKIVGGNLTEDVAAFIGDDYTTDGSTVTSDNYWNALVESTDSTSYINGGSVQTSGALGVAEDIDGDGVYTYSSASLETDLAEVYYYDGTSWSKLCDSLEDGDTITTSWEQNGTTYSADFTYTSGSTTLQDYLTFLTGGVDRVANISSVADAESSDNTDTTGGVMGTITVAGNSEYGTQVETAGAFTRTLTSSVDGDGDGTADDFFAISLVSNIGDNNAISNLTISTKNSVRTNVFSDDADYGSLSGASSDTTTLTLYDSLGEEHEVSVTLTLVSQTESTSTYRWIATSSEDANDVWSASGGTNSVVGTGTVSFDSSGAYIAGSQTSETGGISLDLGDSGANTPLTLTVTNGSTDTQGFDLSGLTFGALEGSLTEANNDGHAAGILESFSVTQEGIIQGSFSNGVVKNLAQLVLAQFTNESGLTSQSGSLYSASPASGAAELGFVDGESTAVYNNMLELSNVEVSEEMTSLITIQRSFQFCSKIVTACDEMLQTAYGLKQ